MLLGDIIKNYRKTNNLSLQDFANLIGTSKSYIHMLEKNINPTTNKPISPSLETLKLIASAMTTDIETLLKTLNPEQEIILNESKYKEQFSEKSIPIKTKVLVPVLGVIPAGIPIEAIEDILDYEEIPESWLKGNKEYFGLKVKGDSMYSEYLDNDTLIIQKQDDCSNGDDCVVMVNGQDSTFKRVYKNDNGITLQPLNSSYQPTFYSNEEIKKLPVKVLGVVIELRRKKK